MCQVCIKRYVMDNQGWAKLEDVVVREFEKFSEAIEFVDHCPLMGYEIEMYIKDYGNNIVYSKRNEVFA